MGSSKPVGGGDRQIRSLIQPRAASARGFCLKSSKPDWREKRRCENYGCPYRKPTQVGGERIPRRSGEPSLRNSAKWPRNFGRRGASRLVACYGSIEATVKWPRRLFSKNTGLCESES